MSHQRQYSDAMLDGMQAVYGEGFLSPGGAEEVGHILEGIPVRGRDVLDLGCGVGGAAILLARELAAGSVLGLDPERHCIERGALAIEAAKVADRVKLELMEPDFLPVTEESFDVVFTKDVICHAEDKLHLYGEVLRVLRPGGVFASGDWIRGDADGAAMAWMHDWESQLHDAGLRFWFEPLDLYVRGMRAVGFRSVEAREDTARSISRTRDELDRALGPNRDRIRASLGHSAYETRVRLTQTRLEALRAGSVEHWHVVAQKAA